MLLSLSKRVTKKNFNPRKTSRPSPFLTLNKGPEKPRFDRPYTKGAKSGRHRRYRRPKFPVKVASRRTRRKRRLTRVLRITKYWRRPRIKHYKYSLLLRYTPRAHVANSYLVRSGLLGSKRRRYFFSPTSSGMTVHLASVRLRAFLLARMQPTFNRLRRRQAYARENVRRLAHSPRRSVQFVADYRVRSSLRRLRSSAPIRRARFGATPRALSWATATSRATIALRTQRLLSSTVLRSRQPHLAAHVAVLTGRAAVALRRRMARAHARRVIKFFLRPVEYSMTGRPKRRRWRTIRKGKRGYAGVFGKRRYRMGRRDRRLVRRTSVRVARRQSLALRAIYAREGCNRSFAGRHRQHMDATKQLFLYPRPSTLRFLQGTRRAQLSLHNKLRALVQLQQRLIRSTLKSAHTGSDRGALPNFHTRTAVKVVKPIVPTVRYQPWRAVSSLTLNACKTSCNFSLLKSTHWMRRKLADLHRISGNKGRRHDSVSRGATSSSARSPQLASLVWHRLQESVAIGSVSQSRATVSSPTFLPAHSRLKHKSFLHNPGWAASPLRYLERRAALSLWQDRRALKAQIIYRKRPRLRLPRTHASRLRRRKGGLGLFTQRLLKDPRTALGLRSELFAPQGALTGMHRYIGRRADTRTSDLRRTDQRTDTLPRHWIRLPRFADLKPMYWVRRVAKIRARLHRLKVLERNYRTRTAQLPTRRVRKLAVSENLVGSQSRNSRVVAARVGAAQRVIYRAKLEQKFITGTPAVRGHRAKNSILRILVAPAISSTNKRHEGLWQARGVRLMHRMERKLSAWSPQYQTRWRRWASPRQYGVLLRRSWPSRRVLRERARLNAALARRYRPRRDYADRAFIHLQYHHGSAASIGYARLRRTHRLHSRFSRWWKSVNQAVPFAHPFSRRALNAKRYYRHSFRTIHVTQPHELTGRLSRLRLPGERMERHIPSRQIPWRNFNYPTPRKGAPATIQRWTLRLTGRGVLTNIPTKGRWRKLVLARQPRELRKLEEDLSSSSVWSDRRWEQIDTATATSAESRYLAQVFKLIPASIWMALKRSAGSLSRYAALQRAILNNFRRWSRKALTTNLSDLPTIKCSPEAVAYLLQLANGALSSAGALEATVASGLALNQQRQLRLTALSQKVAFKRDQFWMRRELPALQQLGLGSNTNPLLRENSNLYKRWLRGAERFLRSSQRGYAPTSRSRYSPNYALDFGRRRVRFPASGRRRKSYDSVLHGFAKRTAPSQFRRVSALRFVRPVCAVGDFRLGLLASGVSASLKRHRPLARKLSQVSTVSRPWRELLAYRASAVVPTKKSTFIAADFSSKLRFASLPANAIFKWNRSRRLQLSSNRNHSMRSVRVGVLRRALRRRRNERVFIDLRAAALQRRAPKERAVRPWKLRRRARARLAARARPWRKRREAKFMVNWGLRHLSAVGTGPANRAPVAKKINAAGQLLTLSRGALRRDRRALQGFTVLFSRRYRRLRRRLRDSRKNRRGRRRRAISPMSAMLWKTHWSEGREVDRLKRTGFRSMRMYVRKFIKPLPKLFTALYGSRRRVTLVSGRDRRASVVTRLIADSAQVSRLRSTERQKNSGALLPPDTLLLHTPTRRLRRLGRPWRRALSLRGVVSRRRLSAIMRRRAQVGAVKQKRTISRKLAATYTGRRLVDTLAELRSVGPLYFQNPTTMVVKSAATKKRELEANISSKETRYKMTAQYVENLTVFIPELINFMVSRKIIEKNDKITLSTARHLIRNVYWSLRIYLNVDPFDGRFTLRDRSPATRVRLTKLMEELSAYQVTEQPQRAALRLRFQPGRLVRVRNKKRFRGDWLRNFLPAQHALYLENADEYGLFLLRTDRIKRLRFGPRGIASWKTARPVINQETRARQLLTLRHSRSKSRFETMLQGTRRLPQPERAPVVGISAGRTNFFARAFSTHAQKSVAMVSRWLRQNRRFVAEDDTTQTVSPYAAVVARYRVLSRIEARGRTNYIGTARGGMPQSFLDLRATRAKSPRSRQYLLRGPSTKGGSPISQVNVLRSYRAVIERLLPRTGSFRWTRGTRRFRRTILQQDNRREASELLYARKLSRGRFTVRCLFSRQIVHGRIASTRHAHAFVSHKVVRPQGWLARARNARSRNVYLSTVESSRSILQHRTASQRSPHQYFKSALAVPSEPITVHPKLITRRAYVTRRTQEILESALRVRRKINLARVAVADAGKLVHSTRKGLVAAKRTAHFADKLFYSKLNRVARRLRGKLVYYSWRKFLRSQERFNASEKVPPILEQRLSEQKALQQETTALRDKKITASASEALLLLESKQHMARLSRIARWIIPSRYTKIRAGAVLTSFTAIAGACATFTRIRRQAPFDTYRARLWDQLTTRRMKRERIARYWIKDTSRWMRDPWIAGIVSLNMRSKPGQLAGELRAREQQIGEYVADVDLRGKNIPEAKARFRERHEFAPRAQPKLTERALVRRAKGVVRHFVRQRLQISRSLRRKPIPAMWLANYEYNDFWREFKAEKAKSPEQRVEERKAKRQEALARAAKNLPPIRERRYALKMPPLPQLPKLIWKEIHRRIRRFEWRESDEVFFRRGFRNAFRFYPKEYNRAPWLEALMYTRATYSTRLHEFRRRSFPREQKKYKWLQRIRKSLFSPRVTRYIKRRKWAQLKIYNQKLHYSLFNLPDRNAARRHFRKLNRRTRPSISNFIDASRGLGDRLDITLVHLKIVPSIFWARVVAPFGLMRVNGVVVKDPAYRFAPADVIHLNWDRIARFQHFFEPSLRRREMFQRRLRRTTSSYPTNLAYHRGTRTLVYKHAPDESDLRRSSRLQPNLFRWFKLDSV